MTEERIGCLDLLLVLLNAKGPQKGKREVVVGKRRLAKLLFLIIKEVSVPGIEMDVSEFIAYKQGPYPVSFNDTIDTAQSMGLVNVQNDNIFEITPNGSSMLKKRLIRPFGSKGKTLAKEVEKIKLKFNDVSEDLLLAYVYLKYPGFTTRSEIKQEVFYTIQKYFSEIARLGEEKSLKEDLEKILDEERRKTLEKFQ